MEKHFKRKFSFEIDKQLASANDFKYKKQKLVIILKNLLPIIPIFGIVGVCFGNHEKEFIRIGVILIIISIWLLSKVIQDSQKIKNNEYILKHGYLIPGVVTKINKDDIEILTIVRFTQNSEEDWAFFSVSRKLHHTNSTLNIGDRIPLTYSIRGIEKGILYKHIDFALIQHGTKSNEVIEEAIGKISEFEWNILERNTNRYVPKSNLSPQFLSGEEIYRYSLDKI